MNNVKNICFAMYEVNSIFKTFQCPRSQAKKKTDKKLPQVRNVSHVDKN